MASAGVVDGFDGSEGVFDVAVVGGGIVGLATAKAFVDRWPDLRVVVLEKETHLGAHQTGRNSGVVHAGLYYKPGSLKARLCREGNQDMARFCEEQDVPYERCGKLIVAATADEVPRLDALETRAGASEIPVHRLRADEIAAHEPHARGVAALWVPSTGITDYGVVLDRLQRWIEDRGARVNMATEALSFAMRGGEHIITTNRGDVRSRFLVTCAGLHSDRITRRAGAALDDRIVPFRGEYYELTHERRHLVNGLLYPVPDPSFPFLGVHFTRMIDGSVHAGPNAVLALAREGYRKRDIVPRDVLDVVTFGGFWRLARRHAGAGMGEVARSFSKRLFVRALRQLIPDIGMDDLVRSQAGVRAQALQPSGALVDDFLFVRGERALHVCNAPSPAATSSLPIGRMIVEQLAEAVRG